MQIAKKENKSPKIVIIGGGFGGVYTARHLARIFADCPEVSPTVTIISKSSYFLFTPLLHEVATGSLNPLTIAEPLREMFRHTAVDVIEDEVTEIDLGERILKLKRDDITVPFDYVIYAGGANTNYYGTKGAEEHTIGLKSLADAVLMRSRIIDSFESAMRANTREEIREILSYVVVGAGASGVELVLELSDFVYGTMCAYYDKAGSKINHDDISITLVSSTDDVIVQFDERIRRVARKALEKEHIKMMLSAKVTEVTPHGVMLASGDMIKAKHVFWMAGVTPVVPVITGLDNPSSIMHKSGRIMMDKYTRVIGREDFFVIGDAGICEEVPQPMLAQVASQQSLAVARNVVATIYSRPLREFKFKLKGSLISLGKWHAGGLINGIVITGPFAWFVWRTVYLMKFNTLRKRVRVAFEWTINLFYPRDITKVG